MHPNLAFIFFECISPTSLHISTPSPSAYMKCWNFSIPSTSQLLDPPPTRPLSHTHTHTHTPTNVEGCLISNTKKLYLISESSYAKFVKLCQHLLSFGQKKYSSTHYKHGKIVIPANISPLSNKCLLPRCL